MKECFKCEKEIEKEQFMYGIDRPYVNLWFHRKCFEEIEDTMKEYLIANYSRLDAAVRKMHWN